MIEIIIKSMPWNDMELMNHMSSQRVNVTPHGTCW